MDRFEGGQELRETDKFCHLHSSMDRFEVLQRMERKRNTDIYIPVWIDLKESIPFGIRGKHQHLHSSMDRFEVKIENEL